MRIPIALCLALLVLFGIACNGDATPQTRTMTGSSASVAGTVTEIAISPPRAPTATPNRRAEPAIDGPLEPASAFEPAHMLGHALTYYVVDTVTGQLFVLTPERAEEIDSPAARPLGWIDSETLDVVVGEGRYRLSLSNDAQPFGELPTPSPTPVPNAALVSATGAYEIRAERTEGSWSLLVGPTGTHPTLRVVNAVGIGQWSPVGDVLAFDGNPCAGFDLFTLDASSGRLRNLTDTIAGPALEFLWKPDASAIAVFVLPDNASRAIDLIDPNTGESKRLVTMPGSGELRALSWDPTGRRLLLWAFRGGRGLCEQGEPRPTSIERIAP